MLLHLAGVFRPQQQPAQHPGQQPSNPNAPTRALPQGLQGMGGRPQAQGAHGIGQGYHGVQAPVTGGLGSMKNTVGLYPHQQQPPNPFTMLAGVQ